jgi:glutamyl-tRNA reductase
MKVICTFLFKVVTPINVQLVSQTLKNKQIKPSELRFGFLGLGNMGSGIVKNLINSGHRVVVWNRTTDKVCACLSSFLLIISEKVCCMFIKQLLIVLFLFHI